MRDGHVIYSLQLHKPCSSTQRSMWLSAVDRDFPKWQKIKSENNSYSTWSSVSKLPFFPSWKDSVEQDGDFATQMMSFPELE
jgi:hypothetical protein